MARIVPLALVVLAAAAPHEAAAQSPLTLEQAVQAALAQNPSLRAARAAAEETREHATAARSGFFPRVSFSESWQRGDEPVFVFSSLLSSRRFAEENFAIDALNHPEATGFFQARIGVDQLLFDGGRQRASLAAASARSAMADTAMEETAASLVLAASRTFGRVLTAQAVLESSRAGLAAAREDRALSERRRDVGIASEADVLALAVHVAELEQRAIQAEGDAAVARAELNRLMGAPIEQEFLALEPPAPEAGAGTELLAALFAEADAARPELRRAAAAEQLADTQHRQARGTLIPQVATRAALDFNGLEFNDRASAWVVGGELRWTFSTGGAELAQVKAATQSAARARAEHDDVRAAVQVEIVSALRGLQTARARQAAGRAAVEQARESQRILRDRFEAGMASVNDVLRASAAVLDAEVSRISALVDAIVSDAMLHRAVGRRP